MDLSSSCDSCKDRHPPELSCHLPHAIPAWVVYKPDGEDAPTMVTPCMDDVVAAEVLTWHTANSGPFADGRPSSRPHIMHKRPENAPHGRFRILRLDLRPYGY